ncbi:unnamed protein product [Ascophyllum nodosum]
MANSSAGKPLSRSERRHKKAIPEPEPTIQIPKGAVIAAVAVMILGVIMGIRTSLQAASGNKPFTLEGKAFEKKGKAGPGGDNVETNPRDTDEEDASNGDWLSDPIMAKSMGLQKCDFDRVHHADMTTKRFSQDYQGVKPVIIEGFVDQKWPAKNRGRWARSSLMDAFGEASVHVSSGAGIVHSGGESLRTVSMKDFLEDLRDGGGDGMSATAFTFDLEFLERNPVLKQDFKVPTIFRSFNSHDSMRRGTSWSILSLGASGAGLPFHNHGETWLGVVYGSKRWALYPPSVSRPYAAEAKAEWHPLEGSLEWLTEVLPALKSAGEVPPLECMQNAGDLIYVPSNWRHMTLNIGETIGVGGQAAYNSEMRLRDSLELMSTRPRDPELLHSVGLGLAHRGISALDHEGGLGVRRDFILDYDTGMDMIKAGGSLTPSQTIDLAAQNLRAAKTDRPGYPETHMLLAETLLKGGRLEEAEKVIEEAWKIFSREELPESVPDSTLVTVQLNLARFFLQAQDGKKAEAYLKKGALALMPDHGDGLADLSVALALQGGDDLDKLREAVAVVERAEELGASGEGFESRRTFVIRTAMMAQREGQAAEEEESKAEEETGVDVEATGGGDGITA